MMSEHEHMGSEADVFLIEQWEHCQRMNESR